MSESMSVVNNPAAYRKRCEPRDRDTCDKALEDFYMEVYALANKYAIADVMIVTQVSMMFGDSDRETFATSSIHIGSESHALEMAAYAHALHRAELETRLNYVKSRAEKTVKR